LPKKDIISATRFFIYKINPNHKLKMNKKNEGMKGLLIRIVGFSLVVGLIFPSSVIATISPDEVPIQVPGEALLREIYDLRQRDLDVQIPVSGYIFPPIALTVWSNLVQWREDKLVELGIEDPAVSEPTEPEEPGIEPLEPDDPVTEPLDPAEPDETPTAYPPGLAKMDTIQAKANI